MESVRDPVSVTPDNLSREYTSFQPCAPEPVVYLGVIATLRTPCVTPSPLSCSRVIFKTRASSSALDKCSHTHFSRRMRSLRTQSSLVSRVLLLIASELKIASPPARIGFFGNNISPHMASEASPERRGRKMEAGCGCAASPIWAPDSRNSQSKDAARRGARSYLGRSSRIANRQPTA